jgi:hypothetical protein
MYRKRLLKVSISLFLILAIGAIAWSATDEVQKDNPYLWKSRVKSVTVFKNDLGFFLRQGEVQLRNGWCVSEAIPPAAFGTFAVFSHQEDEGVDIVGSGPGEIIEFDDTDAPKDIASKQTRIEQCKYLTIQLNYREKGTDRTAVGQLVSVGNDYAVLQAENNSFAVPLEGIKKLQVLQKPLRVHVAKNSGKEITKTTLGMAYLRKGITWIPQYTLDLIDENVAEITLRGTLVNEAEDLVHCDVNFVVGVPHFVHAEYLEPIAVGQVIRTIGAAVAPREVMTQLSNAASIATVEPSVYDQPVSSSGRSIRDVIGNLPQWSGTGADDLAVYTKHDLTIRRGEKAIVTLMVKRIKYSHIYRWDVPNDIKHFLVLQNSTDSPLTTGPCLVVSNRNAVSEDLLKYIPNGSSGELPVTTAVNISHEQKETEIDRKLKSYQPNNNFFVDLVTMKGELKLRNYGKKAVEIKIELDLQGKPLTASDNGIISLNTGNLKLLERTGTITWDLQLNPDEPKSIEYQYERYVPSQ